MSLKMRDIFYRMLDGQSTLDKNNMQQLHIIFKTTSPKMEDDLNQNDIRTHLKWKTTSPKMEDDLIQNGRRAHPNWKMTSPKMEDTIPKI